MPKKQSELKRGTIRLMANYARVLIFLILSILFVPIFILGVGVDAFGILGLLGASVGIAEMCQAIVRESMIRELGAAYHDADREEFPKVYNAAILLSGFAGVIAMMLYAGVFFLLPVLNIPPELLNATKWMLLSKALLSVLVIFTAPQVNMYRVTERMVHYNLWKTLNRSTDLAVAVVLFLLLGIRDPSQGLILFAFFSVGSSAAVNLFAVFFMLRLEGRKMIPSPSIITRESVRSLMGAVGWNSLAVTALNLHIRVDQFIMNIFFGTVGNAIFHLGVRMTAYVWQLAMSTVDGLDAVSARLSSGKEREKGVRDMLHHSMRLQAAVTLPAGLVIIILAEPLMKLWVGRTVDNPDVLAKGIAITQVLILGGVARGLAACWIRVLYGAGFVRAYAPLMLIAGLCNPLIAIALILLLPASVSYLGPALAFSTIFIGFNFLILPFIAARCLSLRVRDVFQPIGKPAVASITAGPLLFTPWIVGQPDSLIALLTTLALYGAACALLGWWYILNAEERDRIVRGIKRGLPPLSPKDRADTQRRTAQDAMPTDSTDELAMDEGITDPPKGIQDHKS